MRLAARAFSSLPAAFAFAVAFHPSLFFRSRAVASKSFAFSTLLGAMPQQRTIYNVERKEKGKRGSVGRGLGLRSLDLIQP